MKKFNSENFTICGIANTMTHFTKSCILCNNMIHTLCIIRITIIIAI